MRAVSFAIAAALLIASATATLQRPPERPYRLSREEVPPLPFPAFATGFLVTETENGVTTTLNGTAQVNSVAQVACFPPATWMVEGNRSTAFLKAGLYNFGEGWSQTINISSRTDIDRCSTGNLTGVTMPAGGAFFLGPLQGATLINATINRETATFWLQSGPLTQVYTASATAPHVPLRIELLMPGYRAVTQFLGEYSPIFELGAVCNRSLYECSHAKCIARPDVAPASLQSALSWACSQESCAPIQTGGANFYPTTVVAHATWAFDKYYQAHASQGGSACDFNGNAQLISCGSLPTTCAVAPEATEAQLVKALQWLCGPQGVQDCAPIQQGGAHYMPNTTRAHAAWAFDAYYHAYRCIPGWDSCDFGGLAALELRDVPQ